MCRAQHLTNNRMLAWDYRLGLRGSGLVVYGALPASLGALGAFKAPDQGTLQLGVHGVPFIIIIATVPVVLTFLLTRQRLSSWYLLDDYLNLRSTLITTGIVVMSTAVCLATRALTKPNLSLALAQWLVLAAPAKANAIWHALLLSFAYLVGSSTLFLTVIKEDSALPLLPKKEELANETELRKRLVETVAAARNFPLEMPGKSLAERATSLAGEIHAAGTAIASLCKSGSDLGRDRFYGELQQEFDALRLAVQDVAGAGNPAAARDKYWGAIPPANPIDAARRERVQRHSRLLVHA